MQPFILVLMNGEKKRCHYDLTNFEDNSHAVLTYCYRLEIQYKPVYIILNIE